MLPLYHFKEFSIFPLTNRLAKKNADEICFASNQIPLTGSHNQKELFTKKKGDRILYSKWRHSLIAFHDQEFAGMAMGYERLAENNQQYPKNSIYLSSIAVVEKFQQQGLGRFLIESWLDYNTKQGFFDLDGNLSFAVQTNLAKWNFHVRRLYESFGFKKIATKKYDNRTDGVWWFEPN